MNLDAASVSDLVNSIKDLLENEFGEVMVQGEITNLSPSSAGHWYFNLSDEDASLSIAMFKMDALRNPLIRNLKNGDKVVVLGPISVYQKRGTFQLVAKRILPAGEGQLKLQFERLKAKLAHEGLFDMEKKRSIPEFPRRVAVITAPHGAALQDFLNVMKRRSLWLDIVIIPAVVQGDASPRSLVEALKKAKALPEIDVIVLTRGGGSIEDLWSFNDEELVREIARSEIPTISAVGHQVDFTLCDYVADFRAETPTAAAEKLSQPQTELKARLTFCQTHLRSELFKLNQRVQIMTQKFHPREMLLKIREKIQAAEKRLSSIRLIDRAHELTNFHEASQRNDELILRLEHSFEKNITAQKARLDQLNLVLKALNPSQVLNRGFSYVKIEGGEVSSTLREYDKVPKGKEVSIVFKDGVGKAIKV